jgi:hypothetical protein
MERESTTHPTLALPGNPLGGHYLVRAGYRRQITRKLVPQEEKDKLTPDGFDFYYSDPSGDTVIKTAKGKIKRFHGNCPLGAELYALAEKTFLAASDFLVLVSENWQYAQVSRMRDVFEDRPGQDHFFETRRCPDYAIRVNPEIRWQIITVWQGNESL